MFQPWGFFNKCFIDPKRQKTIYQMTNTPQFSCRKRLTDGCIFRSFDLLQRLKSAERESEWSERPCICWKRYLIFLLSKNTFSVSHEKITFFQSYWNKLANKMELFDAGCAIRKPLLKLFVLGNPISRWEPFQILYKVKSVFRWHLSMEYFSCKLFQDLSFHNSCWCYSHGINFSTCAYFSIYLLVVNY